MPRGNDSEAAAEELTQSTGLQPNAEQIVAANKARFPRELRAASVKPVNREATEALDAKKVAKLAGDGKLRDYAVRGDSVVILVEGEDGRVQKYAHPLSEVKSGRKSKSKKDEVEEAEAAAEEGARQKTTDPQPVEVETKD